MGQMEGKIAVVAGYDSPLRAAAAERLRDEGAEVALIEPRGAAVRAAAERAGRLDALVNVLRTGEPCGPFAETSGEGLQAMLGQVASFAETMRAAYPWLKPARGRVVNVCSLYGATTYGAVSDTVAADHALQGLTRAVGLEWAREELLVNCVAPGLIDTPELRAFRERHPAHAERRLNGVPLQRLGDPVEDFGGALMFLLSDEACFIAGHAVYADGGQHLSPALFNPGGPFVGEA